MAEPFTQSFRSLIPTYFDQPWQPEDGLSREELHEALRESGVQIPTALEDLYLSVGAVEDLMEAYYFVWDPDELEIEEGYLLFMEDEDEQYTWGIPVDSLDVPDPLIARRPNAKGGWVPMDATVSEYFMDYFAWVFEEVLPALETVDATGDVDPDVVALDGPEK